VANINKEKAESGHFGIYTEFTYNLRAF
jgi:hypothetical protein